MSHSNGIESAFNILSRVQGKTATTNKDQWLKQLETAYLKERSEQPNSDRRQHNLAERDTEYLPQEKTFPEEGPFEPELAMQPIAAGAQQQSVKSAVTPLQMNIGIETAKLSIAMAKNSMPPASSLLGQNSLSEPTKVSDTQQSQVKTYLYKEQQYFELNRTFGTRMTENGLHVWLRDIDLGEEASAKIVQRLREGLRALGVQLLSVSINGRAVWEQQATQNEIEPSSLDDGINRVY